MQPHTEADPAALLFTFSALFGGMVGEAAEYIADGARHIPALYVAQVGRSSRARKDTAHRRAAQVVDRIEEGWFDRHNVGSFGSGESMVEACSESPGATLLLVESELSRLFVVASRDGSTASQVLRAGWDYQPLKYRTRSAKNIDAPPTPMVLIGNITAEELTDQRAGLRSNDIANGFGNRIAWCYADRRQRLHESSDPDEAELSALVKDLHDSLAVARGAWRMRRSAEANALWRDLYERMANDDPPGPVGKLTSRAEAQVLRFSMVTALMNGSTVIDRPHLESAWEMWRYVRWSVQHIWSPNYNTGDRDLDRIVGLLASGDEIAGRDLDRMFGDRAPDVRQRAVAQRIADVKTVPAGSKGGHPFVLLVAPEQPKQRNNPGWWTTVGFKR